MEMIVKQANAKINLALDVIRKREDGYHEVRMIMQTVAICDELTFSKRKQPGIRIQTDVVDIPTDKNNLIYKAAQMLLGDRLKEEGLDITLKKVIPVAAGMAGGSADAAAAFIGINELFELRKTKQELMELGVTIGADIPYCILGGTALSEGIGERLTPLFAPSDCFLVIAKPDIYVSTKYVYENLRVNELAKHPDIDAMAQALEEKDLDAVCRYMENVLETVTVTKYPIIEEIKAIMKQNGAINAIMSGSGPTVFGIFKEKETADKVYKILQEQQLTKQMFVTTFAKTSDK